MAVILDHLLTVGEDRRVVDHFDNLLQLGIIFPVLEQRLDQVVVGITLHQHDRRQGQYAVQQIAAHRLSQVRRVALEIQQVVAHLERHADVVAVVAQCFDLVLGRFTQNGARLAGGAEQRRRLTVDAVLVYIPGLRGVEGCVILHQLPASQFHDRLGKPADHPNVVGVADKGGRGGEDIVAEEHRHMGAPGVADGRPAAAQWRVVHCVVMDQGGQVQKFHGAGHDDGTFLVVGVKLGCQQSYGWTNPFAAAVGHVLQQRLDWRSLRFRQAAKSVIYSGQSVLDRRVDGCCAFV